MSICDTCQANYCSIMIFAYEWYVLRVFTNSVVAILKIHSEDGALTVLMLDLTPRSITFGKTIRYQNPMEVKSVVETKLFNISTITIPKSCWKEKGYLKICSIQ